MNANYDVVSFYLYGSLVNDVLKGEDVDIARVSSQIAMKDKVAMQVKLHDIFEALRLDIFW